MEEKKMNKNDIENRIKELEATLTGNLMEDMDTKDQIHTLKMQLEGITPNRNNDVECVGCGS